MSRDPYGGNLWDPSSQHRYKYARANPVNYMDPSGRGALGELGLDLGCKITQTAAIMYEARQVACLYKLDAAMLNAISQPRAANQVFESAEADFDACEESITFTQIATDTAIGLGTGIVFDGVIGWLLEDAEGGAGRAGCASRPGTPIHTDHGAVPIEQIKAGDKVWAHNTQTGADELRTVTAVAPQHRDKLVELRIAGEKNTLRATPVHPFRARRNASAPVLDEKDAETRVPGRPGPWHRPPSRIHRLRQRPHDPAPPMATYVGRNPMANAA